MPRDPGLAGRGKSVGVLRFFKGLSSSGPGPRAFDPIFGGPKIPPKMASFCDGLGDPFRTSFFGPRFFPENTENWCRPGKLKNTCVFGTHIRRLDSSRGSYRAGSRMGTIGLATAF